MYLIKLGTYYFTGSAFSPLQADAKRYDIVTSDISRAYLDTFIPGARFVKLTPRPTDFDRGYDRGYVDAQINKAMADPGYSSDEWI